VTVALSWLLVQDCGAHGSLDEARLMWNTDASLVPSKNENQTAATVQENRF